MLGIALTEYQRTEHFDKAATVRRVVDKFKGDSREQSGIEKSQSKENEKCQKDCGNTTQITK